MAKIRNNYESSWWPRLLQWLEDGSTVLDEDIEQGLEAVSDDHLLPAKGGRAGGVMAGGGVQRRNREAGPGSRGLQRWPRRHTAGGQGTVEPLLGGME